MLNDRTTTSSLWSKEIYVHVLCYSVVHTSVAGLSLRARGRGFPPAIMNMTPGYFRSETRSCLFGSLPTNFICLAT